MSGISNQIIGVKVAPATNASRIMKAIPLITSHVESAMGTFLMAGPSSPLLGVSATNKKCKTCMQSHIKQCLGHVGIIPNTMTYLNSNMTTLVSILATLNCQMCHKLVLAEKKRKTFPPINTKSFTDIVKTVEGFKKYIISLKNSRCPHCQTSIAIYKPSLDTTLEMIYFSQKIVMRCSELDSLRESLSDCIGWKEILGHENYKKLLEMAFVTSVNILPTSDRNAMQHPTTNALQSSCISLEYENLLHLNEQLQRSDSGLKDMRGNISPLELNLNFFDSIRNLITGHAENKIKFMTTRHVKPESLLSVGTKEGLLRRSYISKIRISSGRDVACCDSNLVYNQVGITKIVAKKISRKTYITIYNAEHYETFKRFDPTEYPRIHSIRRKGCLYDRNSKEFYQMRLQQGDLIDRDLENGDLITITRAPVMLPGNYIACSIKIYLGDDEKSAGVFVNPTTMSKLLGGDHDGDTLIEMFDNKESMRGDMNYLLGGEMRLRSIKNGKTTMGATNDAAIGQVLATHSNVSIPDNLFFVFISEIGISPIEVPKLIKKWNSSKKRSGDFVCLFLPDNLNISLPCGFNIGGVTFLDNPHPTNFVVENGHYVSGLMTPNLGGGGVIDSLADILHTNLKQVDTMNILHKMQRCAEIMLVYLGITCPHEKMKADPEIRHGIKMMQNLQIKECNQRHKILEVIPHIAPVSGMQRPFGEAMLTLSPTNHLPEILATFPEGGDNELILLIGAIKDKLSLFSKSVCGPGVLFLQENMAGRPKLPRLNPFTKINSTDIRDNGCVLHSYKEGVTIPELMQQANESRNSLVERKVGCQGPGYISRCMKINISGLCSVSCGLILDGPMSNNACVLTGAFGTSGGRPEMVQFIKHKEWISKSPFKMKSKFMIPSAEAKTISLQVCSLSPLFDLYKDMYYHLLDVYKNTSASVSSSVYLSQIDILLNFSQIIWDLEKLPNDECDMESHSVLQAFIHAVRYIWYGQEAIMNNFKLPKYQTNLLAAQLINILYNIPPCNVILVNSDALNKKLKGIYSQMGWHLLAPSSPIGVVVACALTEEMTQNALDAPSTNKKVFEELNQFEKTLNSGASKSGYELASCQVDELEGSYLQYLFICLGDLDPKMELYTQIPLHIISKFLLKPPSNNHLHIICRFSKINMQKNGIGSVNLMLSLVSETDFFITYVGTHKTEVVFLISMPMPESPTFSSLQMHCKKSLNSIHVKGIPGILRITPRTTIRNMIEDDEIIEKKVHYLEVVTNSLEALKKIKGVHWSKIYFQNPEAHEKYFGHFSAQISMVHNGYLMFPNQNMGHILALGAFSFMKEKFIPANSWCLGKIYNDRVLQFGSISAPRQKILQAPFNCEEISLSDPVSTMITGASMQYGSAAFLSLESFD